MPESPWTEPARAAAEIAAACRSATASPYFYYVGSAPCPAPPALDGRELVFERLARLLVLALERPACGLPRAVLTERPEPALELALIARGVFPRRFGGGVLLALAEDRDESGRPLREVLSAEAAPIVLCRAADGWEGAGPAGYRFEDRPETAAPPAAEPHGVAQPAEGAPPAALVWLHSPAGELPAAPSLPPARGALPAYAWLDMLLREAAGSEPPADMLSPAAQVAAARTALGAAAHGLAQPAETLAPTPLAEALGWAAAGDYVRAVAALPAAEEVGAESAWRLANGLGQQAGIAAEGRAALLAEAAANAADDALRAAAEAELLEVQLATGGERDAPATARRVAASASRLPPPLRWRSLYQAGTALLAQGHADEAAAAFRTIPVGEPLAAAAALDRAVALVLAGQPEQALDAFEQAMKLAGENELRQAAGLGRARLLAAAGRHAEALECLAARGAGRLDAARLEQRLPSLLALERLEDAVNDYDALCEARAGESLAPLERELAQAMFGRARRLHEKGDEPAASAAYDALAERFGGSTEPTVQALVLEALAGRADLLGSRDREAALAAYDELARRFAYAGHPGLSPRLAAALMRKAQLLAAAGRSDEELASYELVVQRFGQVEAPAVQEQVVKALGNRAYLLLHRAKRALAHAAPEGAELLAAAADSLQGALARTGERPEPLATLSYVRFLQGDERAARLALLRAILLGGEQMRALALEFEEVSPLAADAAFRRFVEAIRRPDYSHGGLASAPLER